VIKGKNLVKEDVRAQGGQGAPRLTRDRGKKTGQEKGSEIRKRKEALEPLARLGENV